jgi:1-acyl-sn-glycerol-3-phosphate acyltransferase
MLFLQEQKRLLYYIVHSVLRFLFLLLTSRRIEDHQNIPPQGAVIFVSNHIELVDSPLLWTSLGRRIYFMAKNELFDSKVIAFFMTRFGVFPVHKERADRQAISKAQQVLAEGKALLIYPEGMRSQSRKIKLAFHGAAFIASYSDVPIVPIGVSGTEQIRGIGWILRRPRINIKVGPAFSLPPLRGRRTKARLSKQTDVIMEYITDLLPTKYRGYYNGKRQDIEG